MEDVNLVAETGLGAWLKKRREKLNLKPKDVAQAASISERTVQRYENDEGLGYETLRVLDALGVRLRPTLAGRAARALNTEVQDLRTRLESVEGQVETGQASIHESLDALRRGIEQIEARLDERDARGRATP